MKISRFRRFATFCVLDLRHSILYIHFLTEITLSLYSFPFHIPFVQFLPFCFRRLNFDCHWKGRDCQIILPRGKEGPDGLDRIKVLISGVRFHLLCAVFHPVTSVWPPHRLIVRSRFRRIPGIFFILDEDPLFPRLILEFIWFTLTFWDRQNPENGLNIWPANGTYFRCDLKTLGWKCKITYRPCAAVEFDSESMWANDLGQIAQRDSLKWNQHHKASKIETNW
jgi:hypothetical protein